MKLLHAQYEKAIPSLKAKLLDSDGIALTSDVWTSNAMEAYISVTAHFISTEWEMKSCFTNKTLSRTSYWPTH